jgi:hypothetical protein
MRRFRVGFCRAMAGEWHRTSRLALRRDSRSDFNGGCRNFAESRGLILQARAAAIDDADRAPGSRPRLDIAAEKLVTA